MLPDEEITESTVTSLQVQRATLRQRTLFEYGLPTEGSQHERGLPKDSADFEVPAQVSLPWGDPVISGQQVDETGIFRIVSHNVNGLSPANDHADVVHMAKAMSDKSVSLFGLQEPNRNFERRSMVESFHRVIRGQSTHHHGAVSSAKLQWPQDYQPGGTAVLIRNQWATRFLEKGADTMGRWSWLTVAGRGTRKITFISAYRVCDGAKEASITSRTVRAQQEWMYADRGHSSIDLRHQFVADIIVVINDLQHKGHDVVVMMDANEASVSGSAVDRMCYSCNLADVHVLSGKIDPPPTYHRGSAKIDFVLISASLVHTVRSVAILALHDGYLSDHRALLVDFDATSLFLSETSRVSPPSERRLTSSNPDAVHKYIKVFKKQLERHNLLAKVLDLQRRSDRGEWSDECLQEWETLDRLLAEIRSAAEGKCDAKRTGMFPWSPALETAGRTLLYWKLRKTGFTNKKTNAKMLATLAKDLTIPAVEIGPQDPKMILKKIRQAGRDFTAVKIQAQDLRADHLRERAMFMAATHSMTEHSACACIEACEKSSRQFRQLRAVFNPGASYGLDRIDVPNSFAVLRQGEDIPRIPLVVKEEIEEVLVPHTVQRFRQHRETPFGSGIRQTSLGMDCSSADATALMLGQYDRELEALSDEARTWLQELKTKDFVNAGAVISTTISTMDWVAGWKKMRESTASAPGGHYGHYKTAAVASTLPEDHPDHLPTLARIYAIMMSLPLKHGFAPSRWQKCIDAILEKIPGQPRIEKLRIIMLYEADFSFVLKLVWGRRLVRHAELYRCLGSENKGCRSGRQTTDAMLEKLFLYEYARLTRTSLITVDNDAKSCYDRIIKPLAMIACIALGLPILAAAMHNRTHHGMEHSIRTRHGTLTPYSGTDADPLEGTGQGSGASPAIWLLYSVSLLRAFQKFTPGMSVSSPFESLLVTILAIFYVDDGMPGVSDSQEDHASPLELLLLQAEQATQSWERLLFVSGGALEMSKCFAYVVYWDLSDGRHRLLLPHEIPGGVTTNEITKGPISLTYGEISPVKHVLETVSPWVGRRTLGCRIAPAGTWKDEFDFRRGQSRELALKIAGAVLPRETARLGYYMMVRPKLEYPLAVTQFTQAECDAITSPVIRACLSKMGYNCNSPKEVIYGPKELFGFGIHDFYIEQGIRQLTALVGHIRQDSETGNMMRIELQWCQVQAGTAKHLLGDPADPIDYIETCWIMCIRDFLRTYGLKIALSYTPVQTTQCAHDEFIMDALRERSGCTATQLQKLNACRLYLQVSRVSDIASADGKFLRNGILTGSESAPYRSSTDWPRQGRPPKLWWSLWKNKLQGVLSQNGVSPTLRNPLGEWTQSAHLAEWDVVYSGMTGRSEIFCRQPEGDYKVYADTVASRGRHQFVSSTSKGRVDHCPSDSVPASLGPRRQDGRQRASFRKQSNLCTDVPDNGRMSFADFVAGQPEYIRTVLQHADLSDATAKAVADHAYNTNNPLHCGSDGGLLLDHGTFGYVWANYSTSQTLTQGNGHVPGYSHGMSSTRSELCGIFAALTHLRLVTQFHHLVAPSTGRECVLHCDSQAALKRTATLSSDRFGTNWRCRANYDLEAAIQSCIRAMKITVTWKWVKGHARRRKKPCEFTWAENLNDQADILASDARNLPRTRDTSHWPEQTISIEGPRGRISGRLDHEIRYCCTATDLLSYWQQRFQWTKAQAATIDIIATQATSRKIRPDMARRIQKLRCGWLPVNNREARSDPDRVSGCSACSPSNVVPETVDHVFQCPAPARRRAIIDRFNGLFTYLRGMKTATSLIIAMQIGALAWIEQRDPPSVDALEIPDNCLGTLVRQAYTEQTALGWNSLFRGFWAKSWRLAQEEQFRTYRSREMNDTGERWAARAQMWFFDTFELVWHLRNNDEHGSDRDTQRLIRLTKAERAIRRLYTAGEDLSYAERHPFRDLIEDLLLQPVQMQELWIDKTTAYLRKAFQRQRARPRGQPAITNFFARLHE